MLVVGLGCLLGYDLDFDRPSDIFMSASHPAEAKGNEAEPQPGTDSEEVSRRGLRAKSSSHMGMGQGEANKKTTKLWTYMFTVMGRLDQNSIAFACAVLV